MLSLYRFKKKTSKYIAVAYATDVTYAAVPSISIVIIEGNKYFLFVEPFKMFVSHMKQFMDICKQNLLEDLFFYFSAKICITFAANNPSTFFYSR